MQSRNTTREQPHCFSALCFIGTGRFQCDDFDETLAALGSGNVSNPFASVPSLKNQSNWGGTFFETACF
jgi:hypothetical protein